MKRASILISCIALFPGTVRSEMITGQEILSLVEIALQRDNQPVPEILAPIRAFPACGHEPVVSPVNGQWSQAELRCDAPAPWRRVLRLRASDLPATQRKPAAHVAGSTLAVVVTRPLTRGQRISADDLAIQPTPSRLGTIHEPESVIGRRVRVSLVPDQPVLERHLEPDYPVSDGEKITLHLSQGEIEIGIAAIALESGWLGDRIRVRPWNSERVVKAEIIAPGQVRVRPNILP